MKYKSQYRYTIVLFLILFLNLNLFAQSGYRIRDLGVIVGVLQTGELNAITDVEGVKVGHYTLIKGDNIRTGVTAIIPHSDNIFEEKVPAAIYIGNGFGKLTGYSQVEELGNIETPIITPSKLVSVINGWNNPASNAKNATR